MKRLSIISFSLFVISLIYSCKAHRRECFLSYTPTLYYVGFDSSDFDQLFLEKYLKCCNFDSLISIDTLSISDLGLYPSKLIDTISAGLYFPGGASYYGIPEYNWIINLTGNKRIKLSNCIHENNTCIIDPPGSHNACICRIKSFEIETENCTYKTNGNTIYIFK